MFYKTYYETVAEYICMNIEIWFCIYQNHFEYRLGNLDFQISRM